MLRARGAQLSRAGLRLDSIAIDLDETLWDWCAPLLRQPLWRGAHREWVFPRRPLVRLLQGISGGTLNAWTAGYGYRVDRVCERSPDLAALLDLHAERGDVAQNRANVVTRLDFATALRRDPSMVTLNPHSSVHWISQKIPGMPTLADKPLVDAARILIDDRETNCRRYVAGGDGRSAIWLRGTPGGWKDNLPLKDLMAPPKFRWADGVADGLEAIAAGRVGLYIAEPVASDHESPCIEVTLPHRHVWREWIRPSRAVDQLLSRRSARS